MLVQHSNFVHIFVSIPSPNQKALEIVLLESKTTSMYFPTKA